MWISFESGAYRTMALKRLNHWFSKLLRTFKVTDNFCVGLRSQEWKMINLGSIGVSHFINISSLGWEVFLKTSCSKKLILRQIIGIGYTASLIAVLHVRAQAKIENLYKSYVSWSKVHASWSQVKLIVLTETESKELCALIHFIEKNVMWKNLKPWLTTNNFPWKLFLQSFLGICYKLIGKCFVICRCEP